METGCMWMRRVRSVLLVNHPSMVSPSATLSIPCSHLTHLSFPSIKQLPLLLPPPNLSLHLTSLFSSMRRSFSTTACLMPLPLVEVGSGDMNAIPQKRAMVLLKEMRYAELEKWVQSHGFRPGQAMILWKRLYGEKYLGTLC